MPELKTKNTAASVSEFIGRLPAARQADVKALTSIMKKATGAAPKMWGSAIVGFGSRTLRYASGRELDWMLVGFAPRKAALALYLLGDWSSGDPLLAKLGKHKRGKGCLYLRSLADVNTKVLAEIVNRSVNKARTG